MKTNYISEEIRHDEIDTMIQLLEEAKYNELKLYELKGYLQGLLNYRDEQREEYYQSLSR